MAARHHRGAGKGHHGTHRSTAKHGGQSKTGRGHHRTTHPKVVKEHLAQEYGKDQRERGLKREK